MAEDRSVWNCHPDLPGEWRKFTLEAQKTSRSDLNSDLWMNFWRCKAPKVTIGCESNTPGASAEDGETHQENMDVINSVDLLNVDNEETPLEATEDQTDCLTDSQMQQINSISLDLIDALAMDHRNIPEELKEDIGSLSTPGISYLLKELRSQLTDQTAYNFCTLLCEDPDHNQWTNLAMVFKFIFLPMLCGKDVVALGGEVKAGLKLLAENFPSECVTYFLKPLLISEQTSPSQLELLSELIPSLPDKDFLCLLRYFIPLCTAPIEERRISVLSCLLSRVKAGVLETKTEPSLHELLPILVSSARLLSESESFANLLLKVIAFLKGISSPRVHADLVAIVQQNNSYNKQALLLAMKSLGS